MASNKVEMSLDDIIKANKGKRRPTTAVAAKPKRGVIKRKSPLKAEGGIKKRKAPVAAAKGGAKRVKAGQRAKARKGAVATVINTATKKLVQKLVKKAISQNQQRKQVVQNVLIPVGRRLQRGELAKKTILHLKGVSQRSRVIARRSQQLAILPQQAKAIRLRAPIVYASPAMSNVVEIPTRRSNYVARHPVYVQQPPVYQLPVARRRRGGGGGGFAANFSIRDQVKAMRQQQPRVVYVQQPRSRPLTQPRRQVYVQPQQQPASRRQRFQQQPQQQRRRPNQARRVFNKNQMVPDPPNFLQRVPSKSSSGSGGNSARRFVY